MFGLESLIGPVVGGLLGASGSGDKTTTQTATKDPWGPAQPYILNNLQNEANLQKYYQQNPFNAQQIQGYSNLFSDINNFRNNVAPGLMNFANQGMTSGYQRATGGAPGSGAGYGTRSGGLLSTGQAGPFSVTPSARQTYTPEQIQSAITESRKQGFGDADIATGLSRLMSSGSGGLLDLNGSMNPFVNGAVKATDVDQLAEIKKQIAELQAALAKAQSAAMGIERGGNGSVDFGGPSGYDGNGYGSGMDGGPHGGGGHDPG